MENSTRPPPGVYFTAFERRFKNICLNLTWSTNTQQSSEKSAVTTKSMFFAFCKFVVINAILAANNMLFPIGTAFDSSFTVLIRRTKMNFNNFTIKSQEAVQKAQEIATAFQHQQIENAHLLKGMLHVDENLNLILNKFKLFRSNTNKLMAVS